MKKVVKSQYVTTSGLLNNDLYLTIRSPSGKILVSTKFANSFSQTFTAEETGMYQITFGNPSSFFSRSGYYEVKASAPRRISVKADVENIIRTTVYRTDTITFKIPTETTETVPTTTRIYTMSYLAPVGAAFLIASGLLLLSLLKTSKKTS